MARYGLAGHVFVCRDEETIVVLDLRQDRYFALEALRTAPLVPALPGWPATLPQGCPSPAPELPCEAAATPLLRQGWLLELPAAGAKDATPVRAAPAVAELVTGDVSVAARQRHGMATALAFLRASVFAKFALRFWRFERVIRRVAERKAARASAARPLDIERARQLVEAFARLRVFLFSSREECLHDSLAMVEFLAGHGIYPDWIFGVRARPFAAHCWVQVEGAVCNDTVEHVSTYVPIMVV